MKKSFITSGPGTIFKAYAMAQLGCKPTNYCSWSAYSIHSGWNKTHVLNMVYNPSCLYQQVISFLGTELIVLIYIQFLLMNAFSFFFFHNSYTRQPHNNAIFGIHKIRPSLLVEMSYWVSLQSTYSRIINLGVNCIHVWMAMAILNGHIIVRHIIMRLRCILNIYWQTFMFFSSFNLCCLVTVSVIRGLVSSSTFFFLLAGAICKTTMQYIGDKVTSKLPGGAIWAPSWENQQCGFRSGPTPTEVYSHRRWLEAESRGIVLSV